MFGNQTGLIRQFLAGYTACLLSVTYGNAIGWISPIQTYLESDQSPIGKVTEYQIAWIASLPYVGCTVGIFLFAPISGHIGRKTMAYILATIYMAANIVIFFTPSYWLLLVARFAIGVCIPGTLSTVTLYISEISDPSIRGNLGSGLIVFCNSGIIIMFVADNLLSYHAYNFVLIAVPAVFMSIFWTMPESPVFYLKRDRLEDCRKSLSWLKATKNETILNDEVDKLRAMFFDQNSGQTQQPSLSWSEVFKTDYYRKAFFLGIVLQSSICCSGIMVFQTFTYTILTHCLDGQHPGKYPLYVLLCGTVTGVVSLFIMHRFSRRFTVIGTRLGCTISLALLGILLILKDEYSYAIPSYYFLSLFASYFLFFSLGFAAIVFVVFGELFSVECRDKFMQPLLLLHFGLFCLFLMLYPITVGKIHLYSWVFIYAGITLILMLIMIVYLPETGKRSISEIAQELTREAEIPMKKNKDVSQP